MGIYTLREKGIVSLFGDNGAEEKKKKLDCFSASLLLRAVTSGLFGDLRRLPLFFSLFSSVVLLSLSSIPLKPLLLQVVSVCRLTRRLTRNPQN